MVDTISSHFNRYEVSPDCEIAVTEIKTQGQEGGHYRNGFLYRNTQGHSIYGEKAELRTPCCQVVIKPARGLRQNEHSQGDLYLNFTAPAIDRPHNFASLNRAEFQEALSSVEGQLRALGISLPILAGGLSRVDLFRNIILDDPFADYSSLLNRLQGKRMSACHHFGGTYYRWGNKQHCIVAYDKRAQMRSRNRDVSGLPLRVMRLEYRMLKARKAKQVLGMTTLGDLAEGYDTLASIWRSAIYATLFSSHAASFASPRGANSNSFSDIQNADLERIGESLAQESELVEDFRHHQQGGRRNWRQNSFAQHGLLHLVDRLGRDAVVGAYDEVTGSNRQRRSDLNQEIEAAIAWRETPRGSSTQSASCRQYQELVAKLLETDCGNSMNRTAGVINNLGQSALLQ